MNTISVFFASYMNGDAERDALDTAARRGQSMAQGRKKPTVIDLYRLPQQVDMYGTVMRNPDEVVADVWPDARLVNSVEYAYDPEWKKLGAKTVKGFHLGLIGSETDLDQMVQGLYLFENEYTKLHTVALVEAYGRRFLSINPSARNMELGELRMIKMARYGRQNGKLWRVHSDSGITEVGTVGSKPDLFSCTMVLSRNLKAVDYTVDSEAHSVTHEFAATQVGGIRTRIFTYRFGDLHLIHHSAAAVEKLVELSDTRGFVDVSFDKPISKERFWAKHRDGIIECPVTICTDYAYLKQMSEKDLRGRSIWTKDGMLFLMHKTARNQVFVDYLELKLIFENPSREERKNG